MTVGELRKILGQLPQELEVLISDGHNCRFYRGQYEVGVYQDMDDKYYVDIGIGGCDE